MKKDPPDVREALRDEPVPPVRGSGSDAGDVAVRPDRPAPAPVNRTI